MYTEYSIASDKALFQLKCLDSFLLFPQNLSIFFVSDFTMKMCYGHSLEKSY